jgi:hypothetical protein
MTTTTITPSSDMQEVDKLMSRKEGEEEEEEEEEN